MAAHPPLTLQDPCLVLPVKIQFVTSSHWPSCCLSSFWTALIETLTQTLTGLITMLVKVPRWGVRQQHEGLAGPHPSAPVALQPWFVQPLFKRYFKIFIYFLTMISNYFSPVNWFVFFSLLSVGNHLGAMVHQRWAERTHISVPFHARWMCS